MKLCCVYIMLCVVGVSDDVVIFLLLFFFDFIENGLCKMNIYVLVVCVGCGEVVMM